MSTQRYKRYLVALLMCLLASNYMDRYVLGLLMQEIKVDLDLSDTQLGLLSGIAFTLFYATLGLPIARWADRGNRVTIIALATATWSAAVAMCGVATSFAQLLVIRIAVGAGEAGLNPPAHSLIADHFDRSERPRAVATYKLGIPLSVVFGYLGAGWLNEIYGWRTTFLLLGLPGLVLAILTASTLRDPRATSLADAKANAAATKDVPADAPPLREVVITLASNKAFRHLLIAYSINLLFGAGISKWQPAFFIRSYGLSTGELGTLLALTTGVCGVVGLYAGGVLASRLAPKSEVLQLKLSAVAYTIAGVAYFTMFLVRDVHAAFGLMALSSLLGYAIVGPLFATIQSLVAPSMRAMSIAIIYLFANLIGAGLGPIAVGVISDALASHGAESLRYALLILTPGFLLCAVHFWLASRTVQADMQVEVEACLATKAVQ